MPDKPPKTVFVLGAGASAASDFGLPVMEGFMSKLESRQSDYTELRRYLKTTYPRQGVSKLNLEEVFTHLELDIEALASIRGYHAEALPAVRKELLDFIRQRLHIDLTSGPVECEIHRRLLDGFAQGLTPHCLLSLNYDLLVDATLRADTSDNKGSRVKDGPLDLLYDLLRPRENVLGALPSLSPEERSSGKYLKLHGSVGWLYCENDTCPNHYVIYPEYLGYRPTDTKAGDPCALCGFGLEAVIVPPTMKKSFERFPKLGLIWRLAHEELKAADRVIFFGVSMAPSDYYLHWLICSSLVYRDPRPEVVVINPCAKAVKTTRQLTGVDPQRYASVEEYLDARDS